MSHESPKGAAPAATLIVTRDRAGNKYPDILMLRRAKSMRFAAEVIVFPGGRVDNADLELALTLPHQLPVSDAAARITAIRETIEEARIAVGVLPSPSEFILDALREGLHEGRNLANLLERHGLTVDFDALTPFSRWCPGPAERSTVSRIFDTRFYVAKAPPGICHARVDNTENDRLFWATASDVLADCASGANLAMFPTLRNLERVALGTNHDDIVAHARRYRIETIIPWIENREGDWHLCIPDHLGYPVRSQDWATVYRG